MMRVKPSWVFALCGFACVGSARAQVSSYTFDAVASGDISGPIHGAFQIDLSRVASSYPIAAPDGTTGLRQLEDPEDSGGPLISWSVAGQSRMRGAYGSPSGAYLERVLLPSGGSRLTIATTAVFAHGASGVQDFTLNFVSPTSVLHDDLLHLPSLWGGVTGAGAYDLSYSAYPSDPERRLHFTFVVTAVPEVAPLILALAGLCVGALFKGRARRRGWR